FTFHRAFDWVKEPEATMEKLIELGCSRVLSSGQKPTAFQGLKNLTQLHIQYGDHIKIIPGGGVNEDNITRFKEAGFVEIHFSASEPTAQLSARVPLVFNGNLYDEC